MRLAIGDIHGRTFWKNYLDKDFSEYYILGDYFDSFDVPFLRQMLNFSDIIAAAKKDTRIKLCLGNHDFQYLLNNGYERYSGFQCEHAFEIQAILLSSIDLLQIVYETSGKIIISHAGLSKTFMNNNGFARPLEINASFRDSLDFLRFNGTEPHGDNMTQGPLWIRPRSLVKDALNGYSQIVGHTPVSEITTREIPQTPYAITLIDTEDTEAVYYF
jgi:hypothetical protein